MGVLARFGRFWYDFLIGDDWLAAGGVAVALGVTALLTERNNPWWLLPVAIGGVLAFSVRRAAAASNRRSDDA